jgi:predicted amidohydrolase YtcJ
MNPRTLARVLSSCALTLYACSAVAATLEADLILDHGAIHVPTGVVSALAIKDGVIVAIGDESAVMASKGPGTKVTDLQGAAVIPGLHDMHVHPMGAGLSKLACTFPQGSGPAVVQAAVQQCAAKHKKGEWITGGQWDAASFGATPPERQFLDRAAPDNPVVLTDISGHSVWANSKALQLAGITASTPNPPGGIIEKDSKGEPTGLLREAGAGLLRGIVPPSTPEQNAEALKSSLDLMLSYGITSFTDAVVDGSILQAYATLSDKGELKQRVKGCLVWSRAMPASSNPSKPEYIEMRNRFARERFSPTCIKIFLDGVPTDSHTAAMVEPYADAGSMDAARAKGLLLVPPDALKAALIDFDKRGFTVKMHAAGDAAVREGLDAIEAARKANGFSGQLHEVAHDSFVQMNDIARARAIGATFEMSPYIWYPNPIIPDIVKSIGPERMKRWIPVKDAIDAGALVVPGSDWSVVPSVNPWIAIETLVTRQKPGGGGEVLGAQERISLQQAIDMFTVNSAREMEDRTKVGTLERGMLADLIVLDRDPYKVPVTQVHDTQVKLAMINGEIVYRAPERGAEKGHSP